MYKLEYKSPYLPFLAKFHDTNLAVGLVVTGFDVKSTTVKKSLFFFAINQLLPFTKAIYGGMKRLLLKNFGSYQLLQKTDSLTLGVGPDLICKINNDKVDTDYVNPDDLKSGERVAEDEYGKEEGRNGKDQEGSRGDGERREEEGKYRG